MDLENPVVSAAQRGLAEELAGDRESALHSYEEAWSVASDDYERCIAAHYMARLLDDPEKQLRWHQSAIGYADAVGDKRVSGFYASLHASVGSLLVQLGNDEAAHCAYELAHARLVDVPPGPYKDSVAEGISQGLAGLRSRLDEGPP